jgi:hypothetical protein
MGSLAKTRRVEWRRSPGREVSSSELDGKGKFVEFGTPREPDEFW